jgi:hypothetical protein
MDLSRMLRWARARLSRTMGDIGEPNLFGLTPENQSSPLLQKLPDNSLQKIRN